MKEKMKQEYNAPKVKVVKFVVEKGFAPYGTTESYNVEMDGQGNAVDQGGKFEYGF